MPDDFFIQPTDIANEIWHVVHQPRSAWSFNVVPRPAVFPLSLEPQRASLLEAKQPTPDLEGVEDVG
jgi:hypothetical protein